MTLPLASRVARFKQHQILDAAVAVFAAKGFHAASMRDIAAAAGIAPGSIYNHFENKAALLLGIFDRMAAQTGKAAPEPAPGIGLRELLIATIRAPLDVVQGETTDLFRVILAEVLVDPGLAVQFRQRVLDPMLAACGNLLGGYLPPAARDTWLQVLSAVILGLILRRLVDGDAAVPAADDVAEALLAGLRGAAA